MNEKAEKETKNIVSNESNVLRKRKNEPTSKRTKKRITSNLDKMFDKPQESTKLSDTTGVDKQTDISRKKKSLKGEDLSSDAKIEKEIVNKTCAKSQTIDKASRKDSEDKSSVDKIYKLKLSKNSIKLKNIETLYPNNIGVKETDSSYFVLYKNKKSADIDLKNNEKEKFLKNKLIVNNFSYKETEESIKKFMKKFGEISEISLEKNKAGVFTGKAVITFSSNVRINEELKLNNKILRVEKIRKLDVNDKRIFVGRIDMTLSILQIRNAIKESGVKPTDIRIRFEKDTHKNIGYGHLTFKDREDALLFEKNFPEIKKVLGKHAFYEYAKEKSLGPKK